MAVLHFSENRLQADAADAGRRPGEILIDEFLIQANRRLCLSRQEVLSKNHIEHCSDASLESRSLEGGQWAYRAYQNLIAG